MSRHWPSLLGPSDPGTHRSPLGRTTLSPCLLPPASFLCSLSRASAPPQVKDVSTTHRPTHRWSGARFRAMSRHWPSLLGPKDPGTHRSLTRPTTLSPCLLPPASFLCSSSRASAPPQVKDVSTTHRRNASVERRSVSGNVASLAFTPRTKDPGTHRSLTRPTTLSPCSLASSLLPLLLVSRLRSSSGERRQHDASANASVERRSVSGNVASLAFTPRTKDPGTHRSSLGPQPFHLVSCLQPPSSAPRRASAPPQVKDVSTTHRPTHRWSGARFRAMSRHWPSLLGPRIPALIARHSAHNPFTLSLASSLLPLLLVSRLRSSSGERRQHDASANASVERRSVSGNVASLAFTPRTKDPGTHRSSLGPQPFHLVSCLQPPSSAPRLAPPLLLR
jgi:hypothetical protein